MNKTRKCPDCGSELEFHKKLCASCKGARIKERDRSRARERMRRLRADFTKEDWQKELVKLEEWKKNNPDRVKLRERNHRRKREHRKYRLPHTLTIDDWQQALTYFSNRCAYCGELCDQLHQEHFIPMAKGGGLTKDNIIPACPDCNYDKLDKPPLDWMVGRPHGLLRYVQIANYLGVL